MNFKRLIAQKVPPDHNSYLSAKKLLSFRNHIVQICYFTIFILHKDIWKCENSNHLFFKTYLLTAAIFGSRICKGQLISKGLFGILNTPKKQTKKFDCTTIIPLVNLFSFVFWEKILNWRHQKDIRSKLTFSRHTKRGKNQVLFMVERRRGK